MNSLITSKWYNLILDCNSVTDSASLSLHRIQKPKPLYFNISRGRNCSSFHHWNQEHVKNKSRLQENWNHNISGHFLRQARVHQPFGIGHKKPVQFIQLGRVPLALWVADGWDLRSQELSNKRKSEYTLPTAFGALWEESSFYLSPQHGSTCSF